MLNAADFRRIVLGLRDAVEGAHMGHPDFRVNGRIFASLNQDETRGMLVLMPFEQERFVREHPSAFQPESGAWGRSGCTRVHLDSVEEEALGEAATLAWRLCVDKGPTRPRGKRSRPDAASKTAAATRSRRTRRRSA